MPFLELMLLLWNYWVCLMKGVIDEYVQMNKYGKKEHCETPSLCVRYIINEWPQIHTHIMILSNTFHNTNIVHN